MRGCLLQINFDDYISILIHHTDLTLTGFVKEKLLPFRLAPEQNLIMMLLWDKDGLHQNEIAEKLQKDKTNITRMICNLERKGFIYRVISEDRRALRVYLTPMGKALRCEVMPVMEKFNQLVCQGISAEEMKLLRRILHKIANNLH